MSAIQLLLKDFTSLLTQNVYIKTIIGGLITVLSFFFDPILAKIYLILLVLTTLDCVLGYVRAAFDKRATSSKLMRAYAFRFVGYAIVSSVMFLLANGMPKVPFVSDIVFLLDDLALSFFVVQEAISVLEHFNEIGIPLPTKLLKSLKKVQTGIDNQFSLQHKDEKEVEEKTEILQEIKK